MRRWNKQFMKSPQHISIASEFFMNAKQHRSKPGSFRAIIELRYTHPSLAELDLRGQRALIQAYHQQRASHQTVSILFYFLLMLDAYKTTT